MHVSTTDDDRSGRPDETQAKQTQKPEKVSKKEQSESLCSEIPQWLQEFMQNLVVDEVPVHGDSQFFLYSSFELFKKREDLGKHFFLNSFLS